MSEEDVGLTGTPEGNAGESAPEGADQQPESQQVDGGAKGKSSVATDPRYAGKSPDELVAIINEQNRHIGRQGNALGEVASLKQSLAELRDYVVQAAQQREQYRQPQQPTPPPQEPEFDLTNPAPYIANITNRIVEERERQRLAYEQQRTAQDAQANYYEGRDAAFTRNPGLFEGIEGAVEQAVRNSYQNGILTPAMLRSQKTWEMAAKVLRIERGEDEKLAAPRRQAVKAVDVEKPGRGAGTEDEEIVLDEYDREEMRRLGLTEKEAKENIRIALRARRDGLQLDRRN